MPLLASTPAPPAAAPPAAAELRQAAPASQADTLVLLLRHGDKTIDERQNFNLSPSGLQRAIAVGRLLPGCFGAPSAIYVYPIQLESGRNARSYQTSVPLAAATGVGITAVPEAVNDSFGVGQRLRQGLGGDGRRLVLIWEHRHMPDLARGLGWSGLTPIANDDFDNLYVLRYRHPGEPPQVQQLRQSELVRNPCYRNAESPLPLIHPAILSGRPATSGADGPAAPQRSAPAPTLSQP